ncbi:MAG: hypothetical protein ACD_56C00146G0023 [uncultured bacterium]|nr:MAG: hypothetical protein ACD_56C00146G0023 [uncultured bacterium]
MTTEKKRFDQWSPLIPRVGQVVQLQLGEHIFDSAVTSRATLDRETFRIAVADPYSEKKIILEITPNASAVGMVDMAADRKPYWRVVPQDIGLTPQSVQLFFLD